MKWIFTVFFAFEALVGWSQQDTINTQNLSSAWIRYEENELIQSFSDEKISSGGFFLVVEDLSDQLLRVCGEEFDLWINSRLIESRGSECQYYETGELTQLFKSDTLYFTISSDNFKKVQVDLLKVEKAVEARYQLPSSRQSAVDNQVWLLFLVLILFFITLFKILDEGTLGNLIRLRIFQGKLEADSTSLLSLSNVLLMVLVALLIGFQQATSMIGNTFQGVVMNFLSVVGLVLIFLLGKILLLRIVARLFRFYRLEGAQIREYLLFTATILFLFLLIEWIAYWFFNSSIHFLLLGPSGSVLISILFLIWVFSRFPRALTNRKLHIISYLCTTEILPTFVLASWLLN